MVADRRPASFVLALALLSISKTACSPGTPTVPTVWPDRAYLGETIAIPVDTNNLPFFPNAEAEEQHDVSVDTVTFEMTDANGDPAVLFPRSVITAGPSGAADSGKIVPAITVTIALIDLPTIAENPNFDYPEYPVLDVPIKIIHPGDPSNEVVKVTILGPETEGKGSRQFAQIWGSGQELEDALSPRPSLRLRAHGPTDCGGSERFFTNGKISGVEFEIEYDTNRVTDPDPIPTANAGRATATASVISTQGAIERARVLILDPDGFNLPDAGNCKRGTGPFLDIAFTKVSEFSVGDFQIYDLYVTKFNGQPMIDDRGGNVSTDYFELIARSNGP